MNQGEGRKLVRHKVDPDLRRQGSCVLVNRQDQKEVSCSCKFRIGILRTVTLLKLRENCVRLVLLHLVSSCECLGSSKWRHSCTYLGTITSKWRVLPFHDYNHISSFLLHLHFHFRTLFFNSIRSFVFVLQLYSVVWIFV